MAQVVGVKFKDTGKIYYFNPNGMQLELEQLVVVDAPHGKEIGKVVLNNRHLDGEILKELRCVIRIADAEDLDRLAMLKQKEKKAFKTFNEKAKKHNLKMKLVEVNYAFDGSKIIFYFIADSRVDFRNLVKDLANIFKARVELRQVGVRDETRLMGGVGNCGKDICCSTFLKEFQPVSIKMAKDQGLALNPVKISGMCGRLMCCLNYEQDLYMELLDDMPPIGTRVKTPDGSGTIIDYELLQKLVKVQLDKNKNAAPVKFNINEVQILNN